MKRGRILIILGIILGLATTVAAFLVLSNGGGGTKQAAGPAEVPKKKALVAMQNVLQAAIIDPALFEAHEFERDQVPADAVLNAADLPGKLAAHDISQGQILRADMLTDKQSIVEDGINASFVIPEGKVAVAFPIDELSSVAYALQAGDSVDLLITVQMIDVDPELQVRLPLPVADATGGQKDLGTQLPRMVSQLTLQDVQVLKIGPWSEPPAPTASATPAPAATGQAASSKKDEPAAPANPTIITLVVTQQDALVLKYARESGATIDFALRARDFHEQVTTEPVTLGYMVQRFNVKPPDKLPYAIEGGAPTQAPAAAKSAATK